MFAFAAIGCRIEKWKCKTVKQKRCCEALLCGCEMNYRPMTQVGKLTPYSVSAHCACSNINCLSQNMDTTYLTQREMQISHLVLGGALSSVSCHGNMMSSSSYLAVLDCMEWIWYRLILSGKDNETQCQSHSTTESAWNVSESATSVSSF